MLIYFKKTKHLVNLDNITNAYIRSTSLSDFTKKVLYFESTEHLGSFSVDIESEEEGLKIIDEILYQYNTGSKVLTI